MHQAFISRYQKRRDVEKLTSNQMNHSHLYFSALIYFHSNIVNVTMLKFLSPLSLIENHLFRRKDCMTKNF